MLFNHRCNKKMRRSIIFIFILIVLFLINCSFHIKQHQLICNQIQPIKALDRSLLFHINGSIKYLGQAHPIYIINLPSRSDRRTESIALIQTIDLEAFIVPAYSVHSPEIYLRNQNHNEFFFKSTELACWASHMRIWITITNYTSSLNDHTWSLIFEDDIDLEIETPHIMQSFPSSIWNDADLIYLGHCANPPGKLIYQSSKHIYRIHQALHPSCTHAYAIRSSIAEKFVSLLSKPSQPIDDSIIKLMNKHQLIVYSIHPPLAIQKPVSKTNPSDVNLINRQSFIYRIQFSIYTFIQWWNGVEFYEKLNKSALKKANLTKAKQWRKMYEKGIWKN